MTTQHDTKPADLARVLSWRPTPEPLEGYAPADSKAERLWLTIVTVCFLLWLGGVGFGLNYVVHARNARLDREKAAMERQIQASEVQK
jgi:hypothetical protein